MTHPDNVTPIRRARPAPGPAFQGTLALELQPYVEPPTTRPVPRPRAGADAVEIAPSDRSNLEQWAHKYARVVVEVISGDRPASQLLRWTRPRIYADLVRRAQLVARAGGHTPGQGRRRTAIRPVVRSVRLCFVTDEAAEAAIHVRYGNRSRAIAARFELVEGRWQCAALDFS